MGFSRQKYWRGLPWPPPGDHPHPGIEPESLRSPELAGAFLTMSTTWEAPMSFCLALTIDPEKAMAPHSSTLAWKIPWTEEPVGYSPWGHEESDTAERLHFHFSLSCTGEGNGNPLQCSCLENPKDGGAWWAAIYGIAQSQT